MLFIDSYSFSQDIDDCFYAEYTQRCLFEHAIIDEQTQMHKSCRLCTNHAELSNYVDAAEKMFVKQVN